MAGLAELDALRPKAASKRIVLDATNQSSGDIGQARRLNHKQIACAHPDKAGGSLERTIHFNNTWGKIGERFKKHGHESWYKL